MYFPRNFTDFKKTYFANCLETAASEISSKNIFKIAALDKFLEAAVGRYFSK